jgi:hypothetical protein
MTVLGKVRWYVLRRTLDSQKTQSLDLACVETQVGDGSRLDCEIVQVEGIRLQVE